MLLILRLLLTFIWLFITFLFGIIISLFRPFNPNNTKIVCILVDKTKYILGYKIEMRNAHYRFNQPCVFISNHQDNMDIFAGSHAIPDQTVTIGKRSLLFVPIFGMFYWLAGNILINRSNKKNALETMDTTAKIINEKKISVWIMPEGTRSRGRGLLPFKKGAFFTAIKAQVPIVPVVISSYINHLNFNKWNAGKIIIEILPPYETKNKHQTDATQLKDEVFAKFSETLKKLDHEIESSNL